MGNANSGSILSRQAGALDTFVAELGHDLSYEKSISSSRFLKTVKCRHRNGYLVVKIFIKPDPGVALRKFHKRLKIERDALVDVVNVYAAQAFLETDRAGYSVRQWVHSNLYDRISTRPFLSPIEKKWISFQILTGLRDARKRKVSHGDIKSENVLVTSWNWVYITDFASYKPTYLPLDNPADFAFFYDTSGRRNCYIAPERFFTAEKNPDISAKKAAIKEDIASGRAEGRRDGKVTEAMDVFSVGCVLAELFLEGAALFTLSQLFKYREGEFDVDGPLNAIEDEQIRGLIRKMITLEPSERPSFDTLLHTSRGTLFPESFYSFYHDFMSSLNDFSAPSIFATTSSNNVPGTPTPTPVTTTRTVSFNDIPPSNDGAAVNVPLPTDSDYRIERIWQEFESIEPHFALESVEETATPVNIEYIPRLTSAQPLQSIFPIVTSIPRREGQARPSELPPYPPRIDGPALIILSLISANIRNCALPSSKLRALDMLLTLSLRLTDESKLDRLVPYIIDMLHDESATVRGNALRTLIQVLMFVTVITPFNAEALPEYILPNIRHLANDPDVSVRCVFAQSLVPLADLATKYLEMAQALKAHGAFKVSGTNSYADDNQYSVTYDASIEELQRYIQEQLSLLLVDNTSVVKRSVLYDVSSLCIFLGRQRTNDVLLSHMITYLNDRDWLLRYAFFDSIVDIAACLGGRSLEDFILPLMLQALSDVEESIVAKVLAALTSLCELGLFQKMRVWELMSATLAFLYHPNVWIRQGAASFIAVAAKRLPATDVWCVLYPSLRHFLRCDIREVNIRSILESLKSPLSRTIYEPAVEWAMKADKSQFWKGSRRVPQKFETGKEGMKRPMKNMNRSTIPKSEEDESQLQKLEQLGMTPTEEAKLIALRDYVLKLANAINSFRTRARMDAHGETLQTVGVAELQKLGIVPETIFLGSRLQDTIRSASYDFSEKTFTPDTPRMHRLSSADIGFNSGAPFEDLRRRLATINGSAASLTPPRLMSDRRTLSVSTQRPTSPALASDLPTVTDRPPSPTESLTSTTNSVSILPRFVTTAVEVQKAAPAVGSSKTNAVGVLEAPGKLLQEGPTVLSDVNSQGTGTSARRTSMLGGLIEGQDIALANYLEHMYPDSRESHHDFGPRVHIGPVRRRTPVRQTFTLREGRHRLDSTLIAHLNSHTAPVTGLAVAADHMFFVSCAEDKTVKVWDAARLERNVTSKARHTYTQHHARVKCICMLEGLHCFASAAEDGSLHVVRVHVSHSGSLPKYTKLQVVCEHRVERPGEYITCMTHFNTDSTSNLVYATTHSLVCILDLKTMCITQTMENSPQWGPIVSICLDKKHTWLVTAALSGVLSLWDLRFGLLIKSWKVGGSPGKSVRIRQCALHPSKGRGRWVMVAVDEQAPSTQPSAVGSRVLVEVWDLEDQTLVERFVSKDLNDTSPTHPDPQATRPAQEELDPAGAIAALVQTRRRARDDPNMAGHDTIDIDPYSGMSGVVSAMVAGVDFAPLSGAGSGRTEMSALSVDGLQTSRTGAGFMITGSEDRKIRLWDLNKIERSTIISGVREGQGKPSFSTLVEAYTVHTETWKETPINALNSGGYRPALLTQHQSALLKNHQDCITAIACIDYPFRGGVITGDRSGVLKVWKIEGLPEPASGGAIS